MNSKSTKAKRKAIPVFSPAELDKREGFERFDHLTDSFEKWLLEEEHTASAKSGSGEKGDGGNHNPD